MINLLELKLEKLANFDYLLRIIIFQKQISGGV